MNPSVETRADAPGWLLGLTALALFTVWSNSFIAIEYLLSGPDPSLDWVALTVARFLPAAAIALVYCLGWRRREVLDALRLYRWRLLACGAFAVPLYNFALGFGQQQGVPAPIASLTTTLAPLFILLLAGLFLAERPTVSLLAGLSLSAVGMWLIATAKRSGVDAPYSWAVVVTAGAPLAWACYSVISKPVTARVSPLVWSYLSMGVGGLLVLPLLPGRVWERWAALDRPGWLALGYLTLPCTVLGFALWTWLLRQLPASAVGLTVFLNPPLTTLSKTILAAVAPATFAFTIGGREWLGGAIVLTGLAIGLGPRLVARSP